MFRPGRGIRRCSRTTTAAGICTGARRTSFRCTASRSTCRRRFAELHYIGKPRALFALDPEQHGWERFGQDHRGEDQPTYMEGAWMTKLAAAITCSTARPAPSTTSTPTAPMSPTTRSGRSNMRRTTRWPTSPAVSCTAPGTAPPSRTSTATGGTPARRGSATTGLSSAASRCSPPRSATTAR